MEDTGRLRPGCGSVLELSLELSNEQISRFRIKTALGDSALERS